MPDLHTLLVASLTARLERARAATPGPWAIWRDLDHQGFFTVGDEAGVIPEGQQMTEGECNPTAHVYVEEDARLIAANDPATEIRRVEAALRVVERHAPTEEINVEWFDSPVTGKAKCCPSCRPDPDEVTHWNPPIGQAGVEPEGFVRSYVLSPCPTIRDLATGEGIEVET